MIEKYFVYYEDDYPDNGGFGMESFDTKEEALNLIVERMKTGLLKPPNLDRYTLIKGYELTLRPVEHITKIEAD